ncbi:MAG: hypothetical protein A2Y25_00415 [Candidatus Melainabacteria bacterium GWF2_37_15]|nr:MAG: hypothetical protein A2Y25_00415 [Candidatus Melainabacteria bacterium GWF2_37_15]
MTSIEIFKKKVSQLIKLDLFNYKNTQLERRITLLMQRNNIPDLDQYYSILESDKEKLTEFIDMITINVTEFFRNEDKFTELENEIIPMLINKHGKNLKIWSAGCSSGAEIYSIAIILHKMNILDKCILIATDFDENIIERAKKAVYSRYEVSENILNKYKNYFTMDESCGTFQLCSEIRSKVSFKKHNLLNNGFEKRFHLILCRNVVIYFTEQAKEKLYKNFYDSLNPDGMLFIGTTERINNYKQLGFNLVSSFFYQKC